MKTTLTYLTVLFFALQTNAQCWQSIASGLFHTVGIKADGTLWAWGDNSNGQLGIGAANFSLAPIQVGTANNWKSIAVGDSFTIALRSSGVLANSNTLWAWGANNYGQLGDGTFVDKYVPTQVGTNTKWTQIAASVNHCMSINDSGTLLNPNIRTLWGWGRNIYGQLGNGVTGNQSTPIQIGTAIDWGQVAAGDGFSIAQKTNGSLFAWGWNNVGELGINSTTLTTTRTQIGNDTDWSSNISAGDNHTLAIKNNGTLWAWGLNSSSELGSGNTTNSLLPIQIGIDTDWSKVDAGSDHSIALKNNGDAYTWGRNNMGQLGIGTTTATLARTIIGGSYATVAAGRRNTIAIRNDGTLNSWGDNQWGQLGDGTTTSTYIPTPIACPATLGIDEQMIINNNISLFPNPSTNGTFSIQSKTTIQSVTAYDILGKQIDVEKNNNSYKINASNGIYTLKITDSDGNSQMKKLIIN